MTIELQAYSLMTTFSKVFETIRTSISELKHDFMMGRSRTTYFDINGPADFIYLYFSNIGRINHDFFIKLEKFGFLRILLALLSFYLSGHSQLLLARAIFQRLEQNLMG